MPLMVLLIATTAFYFYFKNWKHAARFGLGVMFLFTGVTHFIPSVSRDFAAMIPPPLTGTMWVIWLTGVLEVAGGIGLMIPRLQKRAAICLILFLIAVFPANIYAATHGVTMRGQPPTQLWIRTIVQCLWMSLLGWSSFAARQPTLRSSSTA